VNFCFNASATNIEITLALQELHLAFMMPNQWLDLYLIYAHMGIFNRPRPA
jgi:hypothetical protein